MRRAHRPLEHKGARGLMLAVALAVALALGLWPLAADAGPWLRRPGNTYLQLSYSRIAAARIFSPDFSIQPLGASYEQHALGAYAEVGLIERWLTASFEGQLFRYNLLVDQGATYGLGDLRLGFWTGLIEKPVRLAAAVLLGIPSGDSSPSAGLGADAEAILHLQVAEQVDTGDASDDAGLRTGDERKGVVELTEHPDVRLADRRVQRTEIVGVRRGRHADRYGADHRNAERELLESGSEHGKLRMHGDSCRDSNVSSCTAQ